MDALLLTFINAAACLALPKLLSTIQDRKFQISQPLKQGSTSLKAKIEITSFPYCTTYLLTGREFCKFRPQFCSKCSPD